METPLLQVGFDKNGEMDFGILGSIQDLDREKMTEFRTMICVAISQAEQMWLRKISPKNLASKTI